MEENQNIEVTEQTPTIVESTPSEEQKKFSEMVAQIAELNLEVDDIVLFRNNVLGRINSISINDADLMYRVYVKVGQDTIITLNEEFKNMMDDRNYDAHKIIAKDFTNEKVIIELDEIVLSKSEAQEQLSSITGQKIIIE